MPRTHVNDRRDVVLLGVGGSAVAHAPHTFRCLRVDVRSDARRVRRRWWWWWFVDAARADTDSNPDGEPGSGVLGALRDVVVRARVKREQRAGGPTAGVRRRFRQRDVSGRHAGVRRQRDPAGDAPVHDQRFSGAAVSAAPAVGGRRHQRAALRRDAAVADDHAARVSVVHIRRARVAGAARQERVPRLPRSRAERLSHAGRPRLREQRYGGVHRLGRAAR